MSATDQMRAMLDELMGTNRDGDGPKIRFDDPGVCKCFLLGCCPHEILQGTRMDIGECPNVHDVALKADYTQAHDRRRYGFEMDALEQLESFIGDCDRRTDQAKKRLRDTQEDLTEDASEKAETISKLGEEIGTKLANAEKLGAEGKVDESLQLMKQVDELSKRKSEVEKEFRDCMPVSTYQQQKLRVCEICSAYLGIHDNDRRLADHFGGKLHLGFIQIREHLAELRETVKAMREERRGGSRYGGGGGDNWRRGNDSRGERSRSRSSRHRRRSRSVSRKRHHHGRHRSRSPKDSRYRDRDRDRERDRDRDRERDRNRNRDDRGSGGGDRRTSRRRSRSRSSSRRRHSKSSRSSAKKSRREQQSSRSQSRSPGKERHRSSRRSRSRSPSSAANPPLSAAQAIAEAPIPPMEMAANGNGAGPAALKSAADEEGKAKSKSPGEASAD